MPKLIVTQRAGDVQEIDGKSGLSVMEVIRHAGIGELLASCGGCRSCGTCHVHVDREFAGRVAPMGDDENALLEFSDHRDETSRLACQIPFGDDLDGLRVRIALED